MKTRDAIFTKLLLRWSVVGNEERKRGRFSSPFSPPSLGWKINDTLQPCPTLFRVIKRVGSQVLLRVACPRVYRCSILHVQLHVVATFEKWGKGRSKEKYIRGNEKILLVEGNEKRKGIRKKNGR